MQVEVEHNGMTAYVEVREVQRGTYAWSFSVRNHHRDMRDRPLQNENIVLREGIEEAKQFIDWLSKQPPEVWTG